MSEMLQDRGAIVAAACGRLSENDASTAAEIIRREYPFEPVALVERKYGALEATKLFIRDGFIDRYAGTRLVFPGVLRVLSISLPEEFPFHPNWKMTHTHEAFWELSPTVDHIVPVARGGLDVEENWATTSMRRNSAKSNWTLDELGWSLHPRGDIRAWDGLLSWFLAHVAKNPTLRSNPHVGRWHRAATGACASVKAEKQ
jgi:5-methylcytosine-specific restriction endonuclease McrA